MRRGITSSPLDAGMNAVLNLFISGAGTYAANINDGIPPGTTQSIKDTLRARDTRMNGLASNGWKNVKPLLIQANRPFEHGAQ
jgi:hypothetical protein